MDGPAIQAVAEAIGAADPLVRIVAARIAATTAHPPFADPVAAAFERETDPVASTEQARALLIIRGPAAVGVVEAKLPTFTPIAAAVYAEWVAAHQPERLAAVLPALAARASTSRAELADAVHQALAGFSERADAGTALLSAWHGVASPLAWRSTMFRVGDRQWPWLETAFQQLPFAERKRFAAIQAAAQKRRASGMTPETEPDASGEPMRLAPPLWPGFLASLFEAAGCKPDRSPSFAVVGAGYRPDGRIATLSPQRASIPGNCTPVVSAIARLALNDSEYPVAAGTTEWLIVPLAADHLECANRTPVESAAGNRVGRDAGIEPPQKTRDVRPDYPPAMQQKRISGLVRVEAVIASTGCVSALRITRGLETGLNYSAIRAVSQWRFTPTLVNGAPVPIKMTFTVTYNVH